MILATHNSLSSYEPKKWWMKMLNFGTTLYNDTTKIPSNVRKQITDKGWIINV